MRTPRHTIVACLEQNASIAMESLNKRHIKKRVLIYYKNTTENRQYQLEHNIIMIETKNDGSDVASKDKKIVDGCWVRL